MRRRRRPLLQRMGDAWSALLGTGGNHYAGGRVDRLTLDWARAPLSADAAIYGNLGKMRERARELARDNAFAAQALRLYADNVAGPKGVGLQCRVVNRQNRLDKDTNATVEAAWRDWGRARYCTTTGKHNWADVQRYVMQLVPGEGEALIRIREHGRAPYGLALQLLDIDLLDEEFNQAPDKGGNEIRMSVEIDGTERPVAYHVLKRHPNDLQRVPVIDRERVRIPAAQIIHLFRTPRLGQTRGMTWFAPVMYNLRMLGAYQEAEVVAARITASKFAVLETSAEAYSGDPQQPFPEPQVADVEPGSVWTPLPGQTISSWDPQHPTQQYRDFVKGMMQSVASGLGLSYASLSGDLEGTSYASGRTGLLQERDHYRAWQCWLIEHLHQRVFERWLDWAGLLGVVDAGKQAAILKAIAWQPRGWSWVDPKNDVEASVLELANGLNSRSRILAEQGQDFEEVIGEQKAEQDLAAEAGVEIIQKPAAAPPADGAPPAKAKPKAA